MHPLAIAGLAWLAASAAAAPTIGRWLARAAAATCPCDGHA